MLRMHYLRPGDEVIRNADMPERMAERSFRTREIDEIERYNEASWIHDQLHLHYPEPRREDPYAENQQEPERRVTQAEVVDSIVNVLRFLQARILLDAEGGSVGRGKGCYVCRH